MVYHTFRERDGSIMSEKKLYLSNVDKKICGVCGGIAEYFGIDSTIIRVIWAVLALAYGTGLLAYIIAAMVIPRNPSY